MTAVATNPRRCGGSRIAGLLLAAVAGGCDSPAVDERVQDVPLSGRLRPVMEASRRSLRSGNGGDPRVRADLDRYFGLAAMLSGNDHRAAAEDSLHALWQRDPGGILWPDLAAFHRNRFTDFERLQALFDHPEFPDSSTALGSYLREWRRSGPRPDGSGYERARALRAELTPFEHVWFTLRLARFVRLQGTADEALHLALDALPAAREVGGWCLEMEAWNEISSALEASDDLNDALHAAVMAEDLAVAVARRTGNRHVVLEARLRRAEVLAKRRDVEPALALYEACVGEARAAGLGSFAGKVLNRAGIFTSAVGRYEEGLSLYREALRGAIEDGDSLNVPRHMANIGRRHLILGNLDSCRVYLEEAERWIRAYPDPDNRARFPLMQAEYHAQMGNFGAVDSLLALAEALTPGFSRIDQLAELHLQLIRQGTERGRPAQVYRSIAFLDSRRNRLQGSFTDRNEVFDLDLAIAEFLGRQGVFARAAEALDRADSALARHPDPARRWELSGARGHLARRRNDPAAAESSFRDCVSLSEESGDEDRLSLSHLWLASHHLDQGRLDVAKSILTSGSADRFEQRFRTRLSAALLRAAIESRGGRFEAARQELERARGLCRPASPPDLLVRLELEAGRALAGAGEYGEAGTAYARAKELLASERQPPGPDDEVFPDRNLGRELAEAMLELALARQGEPVRGPDAEAALHEVEALLPAWRRSDGAAAPPLAEPQLIFFVGAGASYRWTVQAGLVTLRRLPGEDALIGAMAPVLADLREPSRDPVVAEIAALTEALGGAVPRGTAGPLVIVPDGPLFSVPWPALAADGGARGEWIDQGPILVADSPRVRRTGSPPAPPGELRLLALGVDAGPRARAAGLGRLRHAEREAREISARWPPGNATLSVGENAGLDGFLGARLPRYDVIHISSHAQAFQGLADQTTLFVAGAADAPVTAAEIRELDLRAELVFLSCCEAVDGVRRGVGPAHAGLARSFLDAGARHVIASGIRVDDEAARHLALRFYEHWLSGVAIEDALRMAQLDLRDGEGRWAHPYYWAFYQVMSAQSGSGPTSQSEKWSTSNDTR